ncbi:sushi domain-containing protein 4-like isoform X2 [Mustela nigripes]|uniref:sushi domain-containing protein 4-like isoform X2 n=1 Tax=Mustela nigripes TaxID=77151 RepID=UPI0028151D92|nr:sushi domain-containing protein 4-like isoform X2 [Mustela nigripes]
MISGAVRDMEGSCLPEEYLFAPPWVLRPVCPLPPTVTHGDFVCHPQPCERYSHRTVVEFSCDAGYSLTSDYKYITCQYGQWFPSYQVYCIQSEQTWPSAHETLLTTWKIVAFTATSVLLVLLLVILARMFQTKFKAHFPTRGPPRSSSSDPDFVVVDGVPVMLPSYDEAVNGAWTRGLARQERRRPAVRASTLQMRSR